MMSTTTLSTETEVSVGRLVPPDTPHAISVSLPKWQDNIDYEEGEKRIVDVQEGGYPRFFIALNIQKLAKICKAKFGTPDEQCMLFPTQKIADQCRSFIQARSTLDGPVVAARLIHLAICPEDKQRVSSADALSSASVDLHIVLFPAHAFALAKQFWQHTGLGISSRLADHCLALLPESSPPSSPPPTTTTTARFPFRTRNKHYSVKGSPQIPSPSSPTFAQAQADEASEDTDVLEHDHSTYLEERYGRNLPLSFAASAKRALRRRISMVLVNDSPNECHAGEKDTALLGPSARGVKEVNEHDVFLYPTGMSAIWSAHQMALAVRPVAKSVCFGFPYTDTLKILEKWGPGCIHLGHGLDSDIDELEIILEREVASNPGQPPILALFTEFPSNPLLRSANLPRLRALADKYDFLIVIDETIGNFVNVETLPFADVVVSSLSKIFSGTANVMGGSLVLNPQGRHYSGLKAHQASHYEDVYFDEDAIYMERNSRDFARRIRLIDANTEAVCDYLLSRSRCSSSPKDKAVIDEVYYPKYITPTHYTSRLTPNGGFGGLFSLTFTSLRASRAFFDALPCYKGPSLGTNFTLACPFVILAHYAELEWAEGLGVPRGLVRVSVGMEERGELLRGFEGAVRAAEEAEAGGSEN